MHEDGTFQTLHTAAVMLHEMFISLTGAGFTEQQALFLVSQLMRTEDE